MNKPTISFCGMTFDLDVFTHSIESPQPLNQQQFDINQIKHSEFSVEFKWAQQHVFQPGKLITIDGHLCKVVAVGEDGSVTLEKAKESE